MKKSPFPMHFFYGICAALLLAACTTSPAPTPPVSPPVSGTTSIPDSASKPVPETTPAPAPSSIVPERTVSSPSRTKSAPQATSPVAPVSSAVPAPAPTPVEAAPRLPQAPDHHRWTELLQRHVDADGKVDYKGFKSDAASLNAYCDSLAAHPPADNWSRQEVLAYWLNAYNAFTIKLIVDNYPIKSILRLDGGKTWDVRRIRLGDKRYSLNQIENEIIRPQFQEPRIHFALNCAARSCPPLYNRAFEADQLEMQLQTRTQLFLNNKNFNKIESGKLRLSKIFDWYSKDFAEIPAFIQPFVGVNINPRASISFEEYDWDLNE